MKRNDDDLFRQQYSVEIDEEGYPIEYEDELYPPQEEAPRKKKSVLRKILVRLLILCVIVLLADLAILLYSGQLWFNEPRKKDFPVRGPVMDNSGGEINWKAMSKQNVQMCYLRATSSDSYIDDSFEKNWESAKRSAVPVGAMHVFDLKTDGKAQAENFLSAMGELKGRLIPAVEISPSIVKRLFAPDVNKVGTNLRDFVDTVKQACGAAPIIKCSSSAYDKYIKGEFNDCMIWYESLFSEPKSDVSWTFWEYTSRMRIEGFEKSDKYLHFSVYRNSEADFKKLIIN